MQHNKRLIAQLEAEDSDGRSEPENWVHSNLVLLAKARQDWLRRLYAIVRDASKKLPDGISTVDEISVERAPA